LRRTLVHFVLYAALAAVIERRNYFDVVLKNYLK
jgi:hypothetical protein